MCKACIPRIPSDMEKAEAFAGQMILTINAGALSTMISVGHRTGLFDVMDTLEPSTSAEIASCAGLKERYVREWLGAMVSGEIVDYNPTDQTYYLSPEKAIFLTRKSNEKNMATITSMLNVWSQVEDQVVNSFRNGGGVNYSEYTRFHEVMGEISQANVGTNLIDKVLPQFETLLNRLESGINVLDIGCGDGQVLMALAHSFPNSQFVGIDICKEPIDIARSKAERFGLDNLIFTSNDLLEYTPGNKFDLITAFDVIHDLAFPDQVLQRVRAWLEDKGQFLMMDINASSHLEQNKENPFATFLYTASTMHCMTVSLAQGGMGLGTVWGKEKAIEMLNDAGFSQLDIKNFEHDLLNNYFLCS